MQKYNLFLLVILFSIVVISAQQIQTLGTFPQGEALNLLQSGDNGSEFFDSCNITSARYPNLTTIVSDVSMTKVGSEFNYTLTATQVNTSGRYLVNGICLLGTDKEAWVYDFIINPQGIEATEQRTDSISRAIYFLFGIGIVLFIAFIVSQNPPIKWTFFIFSVIFLIASLNVISISLADEVVNPNLISFFDSFTAIAFYFYWFAAGVLIIMWALTFLNTWLFKKNMRNLNQYGGT